MGFSLLTTAAETQVPESRRPLRVIGIDLGTTNSAVAEILVPAELSKAPEAHCIDIEQPTRQGPQFHTLVPSVLACHDGQIYVGAGAKDLRARMGDLNLERNRNIFWDCKNDIGVRRTYHKAPMGFRSAKEIGGLLLKFLTESASEGGNQSTDATVVTVPASFQAAQRRDTLDAADLANIDLTPGALLDEPVAAFLDYLFAHGAEIISGTSEPRRFMVFDFGGGTCDVALFEMRPPRPDGPAGIWVAPLAVSRYHRLGGGDIDRAIVVEVLIPQLVKQNELHAHALDYRAKADYVIPALLGCAESLKIGLCREIARLKKFGRYEDERSKLVQKNPGVYPCTLRDGTTLRLQSPTLSVFEFETVLNQFLDRDLLYPRETDYLMTCSVFAPLQDALTRSNLEREDVDLCLLVGGSSLIPQIAEAIDGFFIAARILSFDDSERTQTAVAHGAAWQALSLAVHGKGLVRPVTSDSISIRTANGLVELIGDGAELPYPSVGDWAESDRLVVPETSLTDDMKLRVELCGGDGRTLMRGIWMIRSIVDKGDPIRLLYRMDSNQVLHLRLGYQDDDDPTREYHLTVENPLTSVVNPHAKRDQVLDLEEQMRTGTLSKTEQRNTVAKIAELESELGHYEKALSLLSSLNRVTPDNGLLNRMGIIAGRLGDHEREEKFYRESASIPSVWKGPLFNLALSQRRQGKPMEAMETIDSAIARQADPSSLILKALLVDKLDYPRTECSVLLERAFAAFGPLAALSEFDLIWYGIGANLAQDGNRQQRAEEERKRRGRRSDPVPDGVLPETKGEIITGQQ